ncbi:hypothetical protein F2Q69_00059092 [Brassica cretica]|uniref:Uncharacterized protein n=1 Tax=Brassica cretica TaxID=69181 RepID=A0A8S9RHV3_BRACR|nr:hypothetical protein F2Q69_00059092 [Brassica cretica]
MYMVLDVPSYTLDIVYEFYVNLANMIKRDGTPWVFVRKHMYEFSPGIINSIFKTPRQEADFPCMSWTTENLDDAVSTITGGKKNGWGNLSMLDVTPSMNIMFKFCVFHWMPTCTLIKVMKAGPPAIAASQWVDYFIDCYVILDGSSLDMVLLTGHVLVSLRIPSLSPEDINIWLVLCFNVFGLNRVGGAIKAVLSLYLFTKGNILSLSKKHE